MVAIYWIENFAEAKLLAVKIFRAPVQPITHHVNEVKPHKLTNLWFGITVVLHEPVKVLQLY